MTARLADDWYGNKHTLIFLGGPQFVKMSYMITNSGPRYVEGILAIVCPLCALTNGVLSLLTTVTADMVNATNILYHIIYHLSSYMIYWDYDGDCGWYGYWCYGLVVIVTTAAAALS